jgi:hypothetical protein
LQSKKLPHYVSIVKKDIAYNSAITYKWGTPSGDRRQVPLGLTLGRTLPIGGKGDALDLNQGMHKLAIKPEGGAGSH